MNEIDDIIDIKKSLNEFNIKLLDLEARIMKGVVKTFEENRLILENMNANIERVVEVMEIIEQKRREPERVVDKRILNKL